LYGCKFLNFSRSKSELDLITRRIILEKEGYSVKCTLKGLGEIQAVRDIFIRHTRAGLDRLSEIQA